MAKYVNTNIGLIPLDDYLNMRATQQGFSSYKDMQSKGYHIDVAQIIEVEEDKKGNLTVHLPSKKTNA